MANQANYATAIRNAFAQLSVANTNRDGTGTLVPLVVGAKTGSRIDRIQFQATGTTTAGQLRLFRTKGNPGTPLATLASSTTTVTATTTLPHGRSNGEKVYVQDAYPPEYNVLGASITVLSATQFTYQVASAPTVAAASDPGYYMTTVAVPVSALWKEVAVSAVVPSASIQAWSGYLASPTDLGLLPLQVGYGWIVQASTNNAETFNVEADYANY